MAAGEKLVMLYWMIEGKYEELTEQPKLESAAVPEADVLGVELVWVLAHFPGKLRADGREDPQRNDLGGETRDHDVDSHVVVRLGVRCRSNGAAGRLQDQGQEIAAHEQDCHGPRLQETQLHAEDRDDAAKT